MHSNCGYKFVSNPGLKKHIKTNHKRNIEIQWCPQKNIHIDSVRTIAMLQKDPLNFYLNYGIKMMAVVSFYSII